MFTCNKEKMAGTKGSGRPGGNPDLAAHQFTTDRPEPLDALLQVRVAASMKAKLQSRENWQEFVRQAIAIALENAE
jgi:hypothetical protein